MEPTPQPRKPSKSIFDIRSTSVSIDIDHSVAPFCRMAVTPSEERVRLFSSSSARSSIDLFIRKPKQHSQRSRSTPNQSKRSRSASLSSRPKSLYYADSGWLQLPEPSLDLQKEVLDLFASILKQEKCPLRYSGSPVSGEPSSILMTEILTPIDLHETGNDVISIQSRSPDFNSMTWTQQKRLLQREYRRLQIWDKDLRGKKEHCIQDFDIDIKGMDVSFSTIGTILAESLSDDSQFKVHVDRITQLSRTKDRGRSFLEHKSHSESKGDPLERLQVAIDELFEQLRFLKRKQLSDPIVPSSGPARTLIWGGRDMESKNAMERRLHDDADWQLSPTSKRVHFSSNVDVRSISDGGRLETQKTGLLFRNASANNSEDQLIRSPKAANSNMITGSRIVLKIADRVDAFRVIKGLLGSEDSKSSREIQKPKFRRMSSSDIPQSFMQDEKSFVDAFKNLSIKPQTPFDKIASVLIDLARFDEESQEAKPYHNTHSSDSEAEVANTLRGLDSSLSVITSLPEWQIYAKADESQYAKSAVFMAYFSLLHKIATYACDFFPALTSQLKSGKGGKDMEHSIQFFDACIERLSSLSKVMGSEFQVFQVELDGIVGKLRNLSRAKDTGTLAGQDEANINFRKCEPLSLACYPLPITDSILPTSSEMDDGKIPDDLVSLSVRDLLVSSGL